MRWTWAQSRKPRCSFSSRRLRSRAPTGSSKPRKSPIPCSSSSSPSLPLRVFSFCSGLSFLLLSRSSFTSRASGWWSSSVSCSPAVKSSRRTSNEADLHHHSIGAPRPALRVARCSGRRRDLGQPERRHPRHSDAFRCHVWRLVAAARPAGRAAGRGDDRRGVPRA